MMPASKPASRSEAALIHGLPDDALMARIVPGDAQALTELFRRRQGEVYRFALHMTASPQISEDVTQDVFIAVMKDAARYDSGAGAGDRPGSVESPGTSSGAGSSAIVRCCRWWTTTRAWNRSCPRSWSIRSTT